MTEIKILPDRNRAYDTRRDNDVIKTPSISIYDVDYAIYYWLSSEIKPTVTDNDRVIEVPIIFANGETWNQVKTKGYLRDKQNKLLAPFAVLRRTSMKEDSRFSINATLRHQVKLFPTRNLENQRDRHSITQNTKPSVEYFLQTLPEFYYFNYELTIWTELTTQLNEVLEAILPTSGTAWGDTYKFTTLVKDTQNITVNTPTDERVVKAVMYFETWGKIISEFELRQSSIEKAYTIKRIVFKNDRTSENFYVTDNIPSEE